LEIAMAKSETPSNKTAAAYRQPCLRADLRLVYDNPVTGKGQVRIVDPRNSRQFAFTEREHALCQAADGSADLATIHAALTAELEGGISLAEVTEFFRRLHILGLLAPEGTRIDPATAPKTGPRAGARSAARSGARLGPRAELGAAAGGPAAKVASRLVPPIRPPLPELRPERHRPPGPLLRQCPVLLRPVPLCPVRRDCAGGGSRPRSPGCDGRGRCGPGRAVG
jgi:hypothetical protein